MSNLNGNTLKNAYAVEEEDFFAEIEQMMSDIESGAIEPRQLNDLDIRRMAIRRNNTLANIERIKAMRDAVVDQWKKRIQVEERKVENYDFIIKEFMKERDETLQLDVGTISPRKVAHKVEVTDPELVGEVINILKTISPDVSLMKEPEPDVTAMKKHLISFLDSQIEAKAAARKQQLDALDAQYNEEIKDIKKPADKKPIAAKYAELKRGPFEQYEREVEALMSQFAQWLPPGVQYVPPTKAVTIRMN